MSDLSSESWNKVLDMWKEIAKFSPEELKFFDLLYQISQLAEEDLDKINEVIEETVERFKNASNN